MVKACVGRSEIPSFYFDYRSRRAGQQVSEDTANAFEALKAKSEVLLLTYVMTRWLIRSCVCWSVILVRCKFVMAMAT